MVRLPFTVIDRSCRRSSGYEQIRPKISFALTDHSSYARLQVFYAVFDPIRGPIVPYQVPETLISQPEDLNKSVAGISSRTDRRPSPTPPSGTPARSHSSSPQRAALWHPNELSPFLPPGPFVQHQEDLHHLSLNRRIASLITRNRSSHRP